MYLKSSRSLPFSLGAASSKIINKRKHKFVIISKNGPNENNTNNYHNNNNNDTNFILNVHELSKKIINENCNNLTVN